MKLAEALKERADLVVHIDQLKTRLNNVILVQEGLEPAMDPKDLMRELSKCFERLEFLIVHINKTNSLTKVEGEDQTVSDLIAKRDVLRMRISAYAGFINRASEDTDRASGREIRILTTVDVKKLVKSKDEFSKELRLLDNRLQELNWTVELI